MTTAKAKSIAGIGIDRPTGDFYPTPAHVTESLLRSESFDGSVLEPACGDGAISEVLIRLGLDVTSRDLFDRGYGETGKDFLFFKDREMFDNVITNPPYSLARQFVETALRASRKKVAMLMKLSFLEGVTRQEMFRSTPFKKIYVFSRRFSMTRAGNPMENKGFISFAWFVWDKDFRGSPTIDWI